MASSFRNTGERWGWRPCSSSAETTQGRDSSRPYHPRTAAAVSPAPPASPPPPAVPGHLCALPGGVSTIARKLGPTYTTSGRFSAHPGPISGDGGPPPTVVGLGQRRPRRREHTRIFRPGPRICRPGFVGTSVVPNPAVTRHSRRGVPRPPQTA